MGMESYANVIDYDDDVERAVKKLQQQLFESGDYRYSSSEHKTIEDALEAAAEDGTGSALDIYGIHSEPEPGCLTPLGDDELQEFFNKSQLSVNDIEMIDNNEKFWTSIGRGEARLITLYNDMGDPEKYYIGGYSFD